VVVLILTEERIGEKKKRAVLGPGLREKLWSRKKRGWPARKEEWPAESLSQDLFATGLRKKSLGSKNELLLLLKVR